MIATKIGRAGTEVRGGATKEQLYRRAQARDIPSRSKMNKRQLENALR